MSGRKSGDGWDDDGAGLLGAAAIGGPGLAVGFGLLRSTQEGRSGLSDLGPAPIGSDPWLLTEVRAAIAREKDIDASKIEVVVREMNVTLSGKVRDQAESSRVERAASGVQGTGKIINELET